MQFSAPQRGGVERTYTFTPGGVQIACADLDIRLIVNMAKQTGWTFYCEPGARSDAIRPEISALLDDLEELRMLAFDTSAQSEARQDVLEADLGQHLWHCRSKLNRVALFGACREASDLSLDTAIPFGDAVASRDDELHRSACLAMIIVPPRVQRCTIVFNPSARR